MHPRYFQCPAIFDDAARKGGNRVSLFLAGGISNCPDWQTSFVNGLLDPLIKKGLFVLNPRRTNWKDGDPALEVQQIKWEFDHLRKASAISFWFCKDTVCPITLYELGTWAMWQATYQKFKPERMRPKQLFVGVEEGFARRRDVETQLSLLLPEIQIAFSLETLASQVTSWYDKIWRKKPR